MDKIIDFKLNEEIANQETISQIEELCKNNELLTVDDINSLLGNLSYLVRKKIADYEGVNMMEYSYSYKCDLAQSMICYYLNNLGIKANPVNTNEVINGVCGHSLVVASFNTESGEKTFLVDPTYIQFFDKEKCSPSKFVILQDRVCISPDPGYFIVENGCEETVKPLLENGYIELTEEVAKAYGDSFFQTKQGTSFDQIKSNVATGLDYIRWFKNYKSNLSKTEEELNNMDLLIKRVDSTPRVRR